MPVRGQFVAAIRRRLPGIVPKALFAAGLVVGLEQLIHPVRFGTGPGFEVTSVARSLAEHGAFANPFSPVVTGPTAVCPPLYPLFLSLLWRLLGSHVLMGFAAAIGNIFANAFTAALLPRLCEAAFGDRRPGLFAGVLWLLAMRIIPGWDTGYTLTLMVCFCVASSWAFATRQRVLCSIATGLLGGAVSLMNPATIPVLALWVTFLLLATPRPRTSAFRLASILLLTIGVSNIPWLVRNYRIWHSVTLRTGFGMTLSASNNPCAASSLVESVRSGCFQQAHPSGGGDEARLAQALGEVAYDRRKTGDALRWISANPDRFRQLTVSRVVEFWFPRPVPPRHIGYAIWAITALSIPGIVLLLKRRHPFAWCAIPLWLFYPLVYYVSISDDRYRYPILWTSVLAAAYFLTAIWPGGKTTDAQPGA
jgi:hypothetical protein